MVTQSETITKIEQKPDSSSDDDLFVPVVPSANNIGQDNGGQEEEEKKETNVQMRDDRQEQVEEKDEASDNENYYIPSTQSTPNIIGNAHSVEYEQEDNPTPKLSTSDTQHPITFIKTRRMKKAKAAASKAEDLKMGLDNVYMGTKVDDSNGF